MINGAVSIDIPPGPVPGRRLVPGLQSPFPMINYTSSMLADDPIAQKICASLDEVLAPIISVLDCYDSYLDVEIAPLDFVRYMSTWILVHPETGWDEHTVRSSLANAIRFYEFRGTARGVRDYLSVVFDVDVTVEDSGSVTTSQDWTDPSTWPTPATPSVHIGISRRGAKSLDMGLVHMVMGSAVPAHVQATVSEGT